MDSHPFSPRGGRLGPTGRCLCKPGRRKPANSFSDPFPSHSRQGQLTPSFLAKRTVMADSGLTQRDQLHVEAHMVIREQPARDVSQ